MLAFFLRGHLAAWGDFTPGTERPTAPTPGRSQLLGLLGACLGLERNDKEGFERLAALRFGVLGLRRVAEESERLVHAPSLRDLHTVKVPQLDKRQPLKDDLSHNVVGHEGIMTHRFYDQDVAHVVVAAGPDDLIDEIETALRRPHFTPFLGRRSCPPAAPFAPLRMGVLSARDAAFEYMKRRRQIVDDGAGTSFRRNRAWQPVLWQADTPGEGATPRLRNDEPAGPPASRIFRSRTVYEEVNPSTSAD